MSDQKETFHVINRRTGAIVAKCATLASARRKRDQKDNEYGAYAHCVKMATGAEAGRQYL